MKVSIIIPVYNVEQHLLRCLSSVYEQTYPNLEVILVDDCGNDNSMDLADRFIQEHSDITWNVVRHERNQGLSAARNTGIRQATGDYLFFLDSDDAITPSAISTLMASIQIMPMDFVVGGIEEVGFKRRMVANNPIEDVFLSDEQQVQEAFFTERYPVIACNKLVKRKFLINNGLFFERGLLHEDLLWSFQVAARAHSAAISSTMTYTYFYNGQSISSAKKLGNFTSYIKIFETFRKMIVQTSGLDKRCVSFLESQKFAAIISLVKDCPALDEATKKRTYKQLTAISAGGDINYYLGDMKTGIKKVIMWLPFRCAETLIKYGM